MLSLTKIGNIKLGIVKNGKPIQTSRILITKATKEGQENFQILENFSPDGEDKVNITLPFDQPNLNFEVSYVGFLTIDGKDYMSKSEGLEKPILLFPLNVEDFGLPVYEVGLLDENMIEHYNMEKTGFLKCMIDNVSGFGEVFYFKTKSINSIRAINDQLNIIYSLTGGKLAGIPLVLKPIKKDLEDKQILFLSLSYEGSLSSLNNFVVDRNNDVLNFSALEELYKSSRETNGIELDPELKIKIDKDADKEMIEIKELAEGKEEIVSEADIALKEIIGDFDKIPLATLKQLFLKLGNADFIDFFNEGNIDIVQSLKLLGDLNKGKNYSSLKKPIKQTKPKAKKETTEEN